MMTPILALRLEVTASRPLLPQERKQIENRLKFAVERSTPLFSVEFSDLYDPSMVRAVSEASAQQ